MREFDPSAPLSPADAVGTAKTAGAAQPSAACLEWLERLVAFPTVSRDSNLDLIHAIRDFLDTQGIESRITHDASGRKANLYATIGPKDRPGIALSGHTDVVPVDDQDWTSDPFRLRQDRGRYYGRGTCDMKGFIAACLALVPAALACDLKTPLHLCFSYDEEIGCLGVRELLKDLETLAVRPKGVIVGEPTNMQVVTAHKGKLSMRCRVRGRACHSSLAPEGVNALEAASRVAVKLFDIAREKAEQGPFDPAYSVPYTTVHVGTMTAGTALNIVPSSASFDFEVRNPPEDDPREVLARVQDYAHGTLEPEMQARAPESGFDWEELTSFPGLMTGDNHPLVALGRRLTGHHLLGKVDFGTEGGRFQEHGIPSIVCGPGSIAQAHKADEYVEASELAACEAMLAGLLDALASGSEAWEAIGKERT